MFEPSGFEKLQQDLKDQARKMSNSIVKEFGDAFQQLPGMMQSVFEKSNPANFKKFVGNISATPNPNQLKDAWKTMKAQTDVLKDQAKIVQAMLQANFLKHMQDEAAYKSLRKQATSVEDLLELDDMRYEQTAKYEKLQSSLLGMEGDMLTVLDASIAKRRLIAGQYQSMVQAQKTLLQQQQIANRIRGAFGVAPQAYNPNAAGGGIGNRVANFFGVGGGGGGGKAFFRNIALEVAVAIGLLLKYAGEVYRTLRQSGMSARQSVSDFGMVMNATVSGWRRGILTGPVEFAKAIGALSNEMGSMDIPKPAIEAVVTLSKGYGVATNEAAKLVDEITRLSGWSRTAADEQLRMARSMASARNLPIGTLMRDLAANAQLFGNYASRGFDAFARSVATARQYGVEMKTISGFADRVVDDFENSIMMGAKIQTILPGFNMEEIMYASQFGTDEDVANSLSNALKGSGIQHLDQLPRSLRNMISSSLGMSSSDIEHLLGGKKEKPGVAEAGPTAKYNDTQENFLNSVGDLTLGNSKLMIALGANTAAILANTASLMFGRGGNVFSGLLSRFRGGATAAATTAGGAAGAAGIQTGAAQFAGATTAAGTVATTGVGGTVGILGKLAKGAPVIGGLVDAVFDYFQQKGSGLTTGQALGHAGLSGAGTGLGMWGGAAAGAAVGSVVPIIGTVIGGLLGGLAGGALGHFGGSKLGDWAVGANGEMQPNTVTPNVQNAGLASMYSNLGTRPDGTYTAPMTPEAPMSPQQMYEVAAAASTHTQKKLGLDKALAQADNTGTANMKEFDTAKMEALLQKILKAVESGHVLMLDGREVGKGVLNAYSRGAN